jgi:hypothetical protein
MDSDPAIASHKLQTDLLAIQNWFKKWRMEANESKSIHVTFTTRRETCPPVHINSVQLPKGENIKYLGLHLDGRMRGGPRTRCGRCGEFPAPARDSKLQSQCSNYTIQPLYQDLRCYCIQSLKNKNKYRCRKLYLKRLDSLEISFRCICRRRCDGPLDPCQLLLIHRAPSLVFFWPVLRNVTNGWNLPLRCVKNLLSPDVLSSLKRMMNGDCRPR